MSAFVTASIVFDERFLARQKSYIEPPQVLDVKALFWNTTLLFSISLLIIINLFVPCFSDTVHLHRRIFQVKREALRTATLHHDVPIDVQGHLEDAVDLHARGQSRLAEKQKARRLQVSFQRPHEGSRGHHEDTRGLREETWTRHEKSRSHHKDNRSHHEYNRSRRKDSQSRREESRSRHRDSRSHHENSRGRHERSRSCYEDSRGHHEDNQSHCEDSRGRHEHCRGHHGDSRGHLEDIVSLREVDRNLRRRVDNILSHLQLITTKSQVRNQIQRLEAQDVKEMRNRWL